MFRKTIECERGINPSELENAIERGVIGVILDAWTAYATIHMKDRDEMERLTPVGGICLGREMFEEVINDFLLEKTEQM